jgi:hypothetical protein
MHPPVEASLAHDRTIASLKKFRDLDKELARRAQEVSYGPEMVELINSVLSGTEGRDAVEQYNEACLELQRIAEGIDSKVRPECDTEESADQTTIRNLFTFGGRVAR